MSRVILHIDLNAFFASAAVINDPSLKGKPIAIGHDSGKSIVSTASYEARKFGVHSAQPVHQAKKLCPNLILVPPNFELYVKLSQQFFNLLKSNYSEKMEVFSIDECFIDISENIKNFDGRPLEYIKGIQKKVKDDLGLGCSIGVAPNKFLAKMASDMKKPQGITILRKRDINKKLWPLEINKMFGIGKKTAPRLKEIAINTIGDLASATNNYELRKILGNQFDSFINLANGIDDSEVISEFEDPKSIGNSSTMFENSDDLEVLKNLLLELSESVSRRASKENLVGNIVRVNIKYFDFKVRSKQKKIKFYTNDKENIYSIALSLFEAIFNYNGVRLLGVTLSNIIPSSHITKQLDLFTYKYYK